ncbi:rhamnan synthesis F family protein [Falsiroseomonas sp. HC035]|uniref:rhamnan synthesis F family protein n=1 Tax=Falsiroseomonas sp. HC035 TaxID=3390999 RepID=UPI003D322CF8
MARTIAEAEKWRPAIRSMAQGSAPLGPRVVLFCHWDGRGRVQEHTRRYAQALRAEGLSLVLASNAERLAPEDAAWAASVFGVVILRRNIGYDFGAWRDALTACGLPRPETTQIILANDSVYGPFRPIGQLLRRIEASMAPVCGLTDSWQQRYHLQSYFVAFRPEAFRSAAWSAFWSRVLPSRSKHHVVTAYEIGLTQAMLRAGIACEALWPYLDLIDQVRREVEEREPYEEVNAIRAAAERRILMAANGRAPMNPTADLWATLLDNGFPFLKRELLRSNPSQVLDIVNWREAVRDIAPEEEEVVRRDLRLAMRERTP